MQSPSLVQSSDLSLIISDSTSLKPQGSWGQHAKPALVRRFYEILRPLPAAKQILFNCPQLWTVAYPAYPLTNLVLDRECSLISANRRLVSQSPWKSLPFIKWTIKDSWAIQATSEKWWLSSFSPLITISFRDWSIFQVTNLRQVGPKGPQSECCY